MAGLLGTLRRGLLSVLRAPGRTLLLAGLLAVSIGLGGSMLAVSGAISQRAQEVQDEIRPQVTVRPAGTFGFAGGGEPLLEEDLAFLGDLPQVVSVEKTVQGEYTGEALVSGITPWGGGQAGGHSLPIIAMGIQPGTQAVLLSGGVATITAGRPLSLDDAGANVVIVGQALAEANALEVGSTIDWEGTPVEVIGLFESGQRFGNNMVIMPFDTGQRLLGLEGEVSEAVVNLDSVASFSTVEQAIRDTLGSDRADVVSDAERVTQVAGSLEGAQNTTTLGMYSSFGVGAAVIVAAMLLVVRERRREIGVLKAIGASNWQVVFQFAAESLAIAVIAGGAGLLVAQAAFGPVTALTVPTAQAQVDAGGFVGFPEHGGGPPGLFGGGIVEAGLTLGSGLLIAGSGIAMALFAALASVWSIAQVKPAEVLRSE